MQSYETSCKVQNIVLDTLKEVSKLKIDKQLVENFEKENKTINRNKTIEKNGHLIDNER